MTLHMLARRTFIRIGAMGAVVAATAAFGATGVAAAQGSSKVVLIVMENKPFAKIIGNRDAPYINSLAGQGELFTQYTGMAGSKSDYLAMTSGMTRVASTRQPNLFQSADASSGAATWVSFQESMTGNCGALSPAKVPGTTVPLYQVGHDPAYQFRHDDTCTSHDVPMTASNFDPSNLPSFSFVTPNDCDDMHTFPANSQPCPAYYGLNGGVNAIQMGDDWLSAVVPQLLAQPGVTVVLTWDEGNSKDERVVTLEAGAGITPGSKDSTAYNHYSLEAGLYAALGLGPAPANGASVTPLPIP